MLKGLLKSNDVFGLDISPELVSQAKRHGIRAVVHDIEGRGEIPLPRISFDVVLLFEIFEHLFDPANLLRKSRGTLKDGGTIYMTLPNKMYPKREEIIQMSLESALKSLYGTRIPMGAKRFADINIWGLPRIKRLLEKEGLRLEGIFGWSWSWDELGKGKRESLWRNYAKAPDLLLKIRKCQAPQSH